MVGSSQHHPDEDVSRLDANKLTAVPLGAVLVHGKEVKVALIWRKVWMLVHVWVQMRRRALSKHSSPGYIYLCQQAVARHTAGEIQKSGSGKSRLCRFDAWRRSGAAGLQHYFSFTFCELFECNPTFSIPA